MIQQEHDQTNIILHTKQFPNKEKQAQEKHFAWEEIFLTQLDA